MESKSYTNDGTVDLRGRPVLSSKTGTWKACAFLVGYEAFERMAFYGIASNLVNYLTTQLHEDIVSSVTNVNNWSGSVWITPILGAYIADTYLGRYWTFTISSLLYVMGMILLTMAVSLKFLKPTCSNGICNKATSSQISFFYTSLYIIALGAGGTKPNISTFGADQFDDFNPNEKKPKVSFFNWWMFSSFVGALVATLCLVYIQENLGWGLGYGIPTVGLIISLFIFYLGTPFYRHKVRKSKSPARDLIQVPIFAFKNRKLQLPNDPSQLHEFEVQYYIDSGKRQIHHTPVFRCLDKAALRDGSSPPCTVTQVESIKLVFGMILIWLVTLIPSTIWAQINTLFVKQGTTLDRSLGSNFKIPAASLGSFVTLSMLLSVPMYDRFFVPFMRKKTGNPRGITLLQRLGIGFVIQVIAIAIAYAVEVRRMHMIKVHNITNPKEVVPMSIFWLLPQYVLLGIADVFNAIGLLEFFYDQSPEDMQSLGTTFFTSGIGVGNFLNSFLVTVVDKITGRGGGGRRGKSWIGNNLNDCHLDYYYGFLLVMSTLNIAAFLWASSRFIYKKEILKVNEGCVQLEGKSLDISPLGLQV
ncbi:protein NRT1/ PTR FAMILY 5.1 [Mercurialis annua]|uniref:protein NRT1/ PTR FAMILY 5.1 n=1 Tax=Mercurialis annua TaxID=3986 RepID=UPI002160C907|nr:protein NRT1/ PTR FAMILY 5.1 [Mercurialis annua]